MRSDTVTLTHADADLVLAEAFELHQQRSAAELMADRLGDAREQLEIARRRLIESRRRVGQLQEVVAQLEVLNAQLARPTSLTRRRPA